ncbi:MAG: hypothetical protein ACLQDM_06750 [Bradyrhizobium sp.]
MLIDAEISRVLQFCSFFELEHRGFRELNAAVEVVSIKDRFDVLEAVAGVQQFAVSSLG